MRSAAWNRALQWLAIAVIAASAAAILLAPAFPTLDGWAHLQTARMLWNGPDGVVFCANPDFVPNQLGHWVLAVLQAAMPGLVAERVLLAGIMLLMSAGLWLLVKAFNGQPAITLLFQPFTCSILLVLGFHNFLLGTGLALLFAALWINHGNQRAWRLLGLLGASLLLVTCHNMALGLFFLITGVFEIARLIATTTGPLRDRAKRFLLFAAACLPAALLAARFSMSTETYISDLPLAEKLEALWHLRSLVLYGADAEAGLISAQRWLMLSALLLAVLFRVLRREESSRGADTLLIVATALLILLVAVPDNLGYAGYIMVRFQLFLVALLVAWAACQRWRPIPMLVIVSTATVIHGLRLNTAVDRMRGMKDMVSFVTDAAVAIPEGSVVMPILHDKNWLLAHLPSLLAAERDLVVLDNYECGPGYAPLRWCPGLPIGVHRHASDRGRCLEWYEEHLVSGALPRIDHIVVLGWAEDEAYCGRENLNRILQERFNPLHENAYAKVYQLRP